MQTGYVNALVFGIVILIVTIIDLYFLINKTPFFVDNQVMIFVFQFGLYIILSIIFYLAWKKERDGKKSQQEFTSATYSMKKCPEYWMRDNNLCQKTLPVSPEDIPPEYRNDSTSYSIQIGSGGDDAGQIDLDSDSYKNQSIAVLCNVQNSPEPWSEMSSLCNAM